MNSKSQYLIIMVILIINNILYHWIIFKIKMIINCIILFINTENDKYFQKILIIILF